MARSTVAGALLPPKSVRKPARTRSPATLAVLLPEGPLNPQTLAHQAGNWADVWQREADDRRERICISSVPIVALFSFACGNVSLNP